MRGITRRLHAASIAVPVTALLLAVTFAVAGCGDDDDGVASTGSTVATTATSPSTTAASTTSVADDVELLVVLAAEGLEFTTQGSGSVSGVDFGSDQQLTVDTVARSLGEPTSQITQPECAAGPQDSARWDDLALAFRDGSFVGWTIGPESTLTTADGIGVGSTVAELEASVGDVQVFDGSLGREFTGGSYFGILQEDADVIDVMSAGEVCVFR